MTMKIGGKLTTWLPPDLQRGVKAMELVHKESLRNLECIDNTLLSYFNITIR